MGSSYTRSRSYGRDDLFLHFINYLLFSLPPSSTLPKFSTFSLSSLSQSISVKTTLSHPHHCQIYIEMI